MRVVLLAILVIMSLLGACASPSAQPEPPSIPQAEPAQAQPPEPIPEQTPSTEIPHYQLTLVSFENALSGAFTGHENLYFSGEVRNGSPLVIEDMQAIITSYDRHDNPVGKYWDSVIPWQIHPGETGLFSLQVDILISSWFYEVSFELPETSIIELAVESGLSKRWEIRPNW